MEIEKGKNEKLPVEDLKFSNSYQILAVLNYTAPAIYVTISRNHFHTVQSTKSLKSYFNQRSVMYMTGRCLKICLDNDR